MRSKVIVLLLVVFSCHILPARAQDGFILIAEAKNVTKKGKKEGKWIEYLDTAMRVTGDAANAPYYRLTIYDDGKADGTVRSFYKSGRMMCEAPYTNGVMNGLVKYYHENGKIKSEATYANGVLEGISREYYPSGKLQTETTYVKGAMNGTMKVYYESGTVKKQSIYGNGREVTTTNYDQDGYDIK